MRREEQLDGSSGVMALVDGLVGSCQLGKERAEAGRSGWGIAKFLAKVAIEASPFVILGVVGGRNSGLLEALLKGCGYCCGKMLDGNAHRPTAPVLGRRL